MPDFRYYDVFVPRGYGRKTEKLLEVLRGTDVVAGPVKDGIAEMVRIMSDLLAPEIERVLNQDLGKDMATVADSEYVEEVEGRTKKVRRSDQFTTPDRGANDVLTPVDKVVSRRRVAEVAEAISKDLQKELARMADGLSALGIGATQLSHVVQRGIDEGGRSEEVQFWIGDMAKWLVEFQGELEGLGSMFSDVRWDYEQIAKAEEDAEIRDRHR